MKGSVFVPGIAVTLVVAAPLLACGCGTKASGPSTWSYTVDFGSVASAVSVDTVEVSVFDVAVVGARCDNLVAARRSKADLPKTVAAFSSSTCDLARNRVPVTVAYATYSIMIVGRP